MNFIYAIIGFMSDLARFGWTFEAQSPMAPSLQRSNMNSTLTDTVVTPKTNIGRILAVMADGKWRSLSSIKNEVEFFYGVTLVDKGLAAQLRDIRKKPEYVVKSQKSNEGLRGTWEYQILLKRDVETGNTPSEPLPTNFEAAQALGKAWGIDDTDCL